MPQTASRALLFRREPKLVVKFSAKDPRLDAWQNGLDVEGVLALTFGQVARVVVPLGHAKFDVGIDKGSAQRLAQYRRAGKGAQRVQQVEGKPRDAGWSCSRLIHVDVEPPAGIALVFDSIQTPG